MKIICAKIKTRQTPTDQSHNITYLILPTMPGPAGGTKASATSSKDVKYPRVTVAPIVVRMVGGEESISGLLHSNELDAAMMHTSLNRHPGTVRKNNTKIIQ